MQKLIGTDLKRVITRNRTVKRAVKPVGMMTPWRKSRIMMKRTTMITKRITLTTARKIMTTLAMEEAAMTAAMVSRTSPVLSAGLVLTSPTDAFD